MVPASNGVDRISGLLKIDMLAARGFFNSIGPKQTYFAPHPMSAFEGEAD
jgi:hypothetical protein